MRTLGWVFVILAVGALALDAWAWSDGAEGGATRTRNCVTAEGFEFRSVWCELYDVHDGAPVAVTSFVQNQIDEPLGLIEEDTSIYLNYVQPALLAQAAPWLAGVGGALLVLSFLLRLVFRPHERARL